MNLPFLKFPIFRAFNSAGDPLNGGLLYTYQAGTTQGLTTYSDAAGASPNANPVVLDTTGSATVRLGFTASYKLVLKDSGGSTQWTEDDYNPLLNVGVWDGSNGSVGAPALSAASDTTTGFYFDTPGQIAVSMGGVTGGEISQGTFTATYPDLYAAPTVTAFWQRWGKEVTINFPPATSTSTQPTFRITGIPAAIQPFTAQWVSIAYGSVIDNGSASGNPAIVVNGSSGTWNVYINGSSSGWTPIGAKGFIQSQTIKYYLI